MGLFLLLRPRTASCSPLHRSSSCPVFCWAAVLASSTWSMPVQHHPTTPPTQTNHPKSSKPSTIATSSKSTKKNKFNFNYSTPPKNLKNPPQAQPQPSHPPQLATSSCHPTQRVRSCRSAASAAENDARLSWWKIRSASNRRSGCILSGWSFYG